MGYSSKLAVLVASTLLSLASFSHGLGQAVVENHCSYTAYLWSVSNFQGPLHVLQPGQSYSETWQLNPAGGGISIKVAETNDISGPIIQFEYTLLGLLWYDLSRINGSPFEAGGVSLVPSSSSCQAVLCPPGGPCDEGSVFYNPDDNFAIEACDSESTIVLTLCSGTSGGGSSPGGNGHHHKGKGHHQQHQPKETSPPVAPPPPPAPFPASSPASVPAPAPPAPTPVTPAPYIPPGDVVVTTFITYYKTVDATVDDIVTVTAK